MEEFNHIPVMLNECIEGLNIKKDGIYVDGTLGGGGHSYEILKRLSPKGRLIVFDKDIYAINYCKDKFKDYKNVTYINSDFKLMPDKLDELGISHIDGLLLDLGVSSYQIDTPSRGFSYRFDGPLDMRMDTSSPFSALDVVNKYKQEDLFRIIKVYGEEDFAKGIARGIVLAREAKPITTTKELCDIIDNSVPAFYKHKSPYKKTFQAIRIEVNHELDGIDTLLESMSARLYKGGRMCVITFHSLEDRAVKNTFKLLTTDCICDKNSPVCTCHHIHSCVPVNKKPILASPNELVINKRSSSAKLRIVEKD